MAVPGIFCLLRSERTGPCSIRGCRCGRCALQGIAEHVEQALEHVGVACHVGEVHFAGKVHHFLHAVRAHTHISGQVDHPAGAGVGPPAQDAVLRRVPVSVVVSIISIVVIVIMICHISSCSVLARDRADLSSICI